MYFSRTAPLAPLPVGKSGERGVADFNQHAAEASAERARIVEWAESIRNADTAIAWLIARPERQMPQVSYPSAVAAYREISEVLKAL
ncbi:hypothetical protein [Mesorhizobium sp. ZC-5]|uniref:hypothetical protein n=1 Tax=Mesorhizobium sp. ZC-5 TaxID=2986066 RepID=UPI0021E88D6E|nr:hypothetical protein [Mesorhizobium sp. ZC-5]MCV3241437.1 hypothetical protein [Mesorhizobium sp. ZC-5]